MKSILILEDDVVLATHWRELLEQYGFRVVHESNHDAAVAALDSEPFDLLLSDILIGSHEEGFAAKGGLNLITYAWLHVHPRPKIIAVTGASPNIDLEAIAEQLHADRWIPKPVSDQALVDTIKSLLGS